MNTASPKLFVSAVAIFFLASVSICQTARTSDWQKINADGLFTFRLPQGFTKTDMAGVENYLGEYYKGKTRFLFIWGDTASYAYDVRRQPEMEDYQETETRIDGKRANIRTYSQIRDGERIYRAELNIGNWEKAEVELYMEVESKNPADLEIAKQIFNSIASLKRNAQYNKSFERTTRQLASHQSCVVLSALCVVGGQPLNSGVRPLYFGIIFINKNFCHPILFKLKFRVKIVREFHLEVLKWQL